MNLKDKITAPQLKALQTVFARRGMSNEERHEFIYNYTNGRTNSTSGLTVGEAKHLLSELGAVGKAEQERRQTEAIKLVKAIYYLSLKIDFLNKGYGSHTEADRQMNYAKINTFCRTRTAAKKPLSSQTVEELEATKKQMEKIARKQLNNEKKAAKP